MRLIFEKSIVAIICLLVACEQDNGTTNESASADTDTTSDSVRDSDAPEETDQDTEFASDVTIDTDTSTDTEDSIPPDDEAPDGHCFQNPLGGYLPVNFSLERGRSVCSFNGQYHLDLQSDGNLVLYQGRYPRWDSQTVNGGASRFSVQDDGNLVLYTDDGQPIWHSGTHGKEGARLALQDDGNLVLYKSGVAIWSTNTNASSVVQAIANKDYSGRTTSQPARIVTPRFPSSEVVVINYDAVEDFGADPTGALDSTLAIQRALDQCFDDGGGTVWLPLGRYKITNTLLVHAFCSLKGDWNDPDNMTSGADYGTMLLAELPPGINGPNLIRVGGSAGVSGLTVFYPRQDINNPLEYNFTVDIPGNGINYMMSSVVNMTLLNAYQGISICSRDGEIHEISTVKNVKGTVLYRGMTAYNGADVSVWQNIRLSNEYWAEAGSEFHAPSLDSLDAWTLAKGTGLVLGDVEWDQFLNVELNSYNVGIHVVPGRRIRFTGSFVNTRVHNSNTALLVDDLDDRWGVGIVASELEGKKYSVVNNSKGYVKLNHTTLSGAVGGTGPIHRLKSPEVTPPNYEDPAINKISRSALYNVTESPFSAPRVIPNREGVIPTWDATAGIQRALDRAGAAGGGIVYFPPGWYRVNGNLAVPANVEIRGACSTPHRDQSGLSLGSVLFVYNGHNSGNADTAEAFVTLRGDSSGVVGLRFFYPENRPDKGIVPYPFAIRGMGKNNYVKNVNFSNVWNGIDFMSYTNENHVIERVVGTVFHRAVLVGGNQKGWISNILTNGNAVVRNGYGLHGWTQESEVFSKVINPVTRVTEILVVTKNTGDEYIANVFGYGSKMGIEHQGGLAKVFNIGTDNLGWGGYTIYAYDTIYVQNAMRYNGKGSTFGANGGGIILYNDNILN